ncbi:Hypothetical protein CINCED_3A005493 [Cinara cedri]|uniref:Uncharacterized protein n=1 Tax=Cinara cedri TaxID=506608 RepID=A0A5E4NPN8_9HEMI|nr:Hypothetical protein CINCED_3A005493 [Cinara cedri]
MACFERRVLRRIYGPILENEVYRRTNVEKALEGKVNGERSKSRPRQHWIDRVSVDLNMYARGLTIEDSIDRNGWLKVVEAAKVLQGP